MKKDWKYIIYLSLFIGIYATVQLLSPKQHNWSITLSHVDKNPYGTYALNEMMPALFDSITHVNETLYELLKSKNTNTAFFSLSTTLNLDKADTETLFSYISKGNTAFLSAHYFNGHFADTLQLNTVDYLFNNQSLIDLRDSISLRFLNSSLDTLTNYKYRKDNAHNYFNSFDTLKTTIIGKNDSDKPVTLRIAIGNGALIVNSTPLAFTNINLLNGENHAFASQSLSYLGNQKLIWTEYYHLGRMEASTPLRFVLSQDSLSSAYYITIFSLLLFILFESKRKQRVIPIIPPVQNTTLEFVATIGNLYYQQGDHKNIADKKIIFLMDTLRSKYHFDPMAETDVSVIARKTGNDEDSTAALFALIKKIQEKDQITVDELISLNEQIENFIK